MQNIYDAIGGKAALEVAVQRFYERVTADPALVTFFDGVDMRELRRHQIVFLSHALGGPDQYKGHMQRAHQHLRIEQRHFDLVVQHLIATLEELAAPDQVIQGIVARLAPLAPHIVNAPAPETAAVA